MHPWQTSEEFRKNHNNLPRQYKDEFASSWARLNAQSAQLAELLHDAERPLRLRSEAPAPLFINLAVRLCNNSDFRFAVTNILDSVQ